MRSNKSRDMIYIPKDNFTVTSAKNADGTNFPDGTLAEVYDQLTHEINGYYEAINGEWYAYKPQGV